MGISSSPGYNLAAVPSPINEPAATGRLRAQAHNAQLVNAIANRSQFENAWNTSNGLRATSAAS